MTRLITCPAGHAWEVADPHSPEEEECPQCGQMAVVSESDDSLDDRQSDTTPLPGGDELPPLPSSFAAPTPTGDRRARPLPKEAPPPKIEGYEILGIIGRGGMGVVYRARQVRLNRQVALKLLRAGHGARPEEITRFRLEAESAARLQHPSIVQIFDIDEHEGHLFCVLEFVEGGTLAEKIGGKPQPIYESAELVATLAKAIEAAHARGILHRDLKPANILLTDDGRPKIADFGLAKMLDDDSGPTMSGAILGTPCYMAPEQAQGRSRDIGRATDVYSLGAILYELLTGRPPFRAATALEVMRQVVSDAPISPRDLREDVPAELARICLKCLAKEPEGRYASGSKLAVDLQAFLDSPKGQALAPPSEWRANRWAIIGTGVFLLIVAIMISVAYAPSWFGWAGPVANPKPPGPVEPAPQPKPEKPEEKPPPKEVNPPIAPAKVEPDPVTQRWTILAAPPGSEKEKFERIAFVSPTVGFLAGQQKVYKTDDGGKSWKALPREEPGSVYAMQFADPKMGWIGSSRLLHTSDGGDSWKPVDLAGVELKQVRAIAVGQKDFRLAGALSAKDELELFVQRSPTGAWERIDPQASRLWGEGERYRQWYVGDLVTLSSTEGLIALMQDDNRAGAILRTADGGASWLPMHSADTGLHRLAAAGRRVWVVGSDGYLAESSDGGQRWESVNGIPDAAGAAALAMAADGKFGLAPLRNGSVLVLQSDGQWETRTDVSLERLRDAVVLSPGVGLVLAADGRVARYEGK